MDAEEWNKKYKIGQRVAVKIDGATTLKTETTSPAWQIYPGTCVVLVKGILVGCNLNRVKPIMED